MISGAADTKGWYSILALTRRTGCVEHGRCCREASGGAKPGGEAAGRSSACDDTGDRWHKHRERGSSATTWTGGDMDGSFRARRVATWKDHFNHTWLFQLYKMSVYIVMGLLCGEGRQLVEVSCGEGRHRHSCDMRHDQTLVGLRISTARPMV